ncbi:MAG: MFS transporter [Legionellaceae bacterium]|nr:MFS transporter [Legionellaceae bacterium]
MIGEKKGVVLAGTFGNALEWYDFTIYAFFVPVIAPLFFPSENSLLSIVAAFGIFAIGFLVRPLGGILFGYIGDHKGRKNALILSMVAMSCPTFLIGLLPVYSSIGIWAPILLTLLRIIQGLAVSGELTTATVFLIEHADKERRGIAGSLAMAGAFIGIVFSSVAASLVTEIVSGASLLAWGWRIPFICGGLVGIFGLVIRLKSADPEIYESAQEGVNTEPQKISVIEHLKGLEYKVVVKGILLTSIMAVANYFIIGYFNTFLVETEKLPMKSVMVIGSIAMTVQMLLSLVMGRLSDFVGRKVVLGGGIISLIILALPIFWLLTQHNLIKAFCGEILFAVSASAISGLIPTTLAEMFDTYNRNTGISVSYNMALAFFGGTAPLVAMSLAMSTNSSYAPAIYLMVCAIIALFVLLPLPETYKKNLT